MNPRQALEKPTSARSSGSEDEYPFDLPSSKAVASVRWDDLARKILGALLENPKTNSQLKTYIAPSSNLPLEEELQRLQRHGLISRTTDARGESPVHTYELTPFGAEVFVSISHAGGNPIREAILRFVHQNPGVPVGKLASELNIGLASLYAYIQPLEQAGIIEVVSHGRGKFLFPIENPELRAIHLLESKVTRDIAKAIISHPGSSIAEIVQNIDKSPRVVYYYVRRMVDAGLVTSMSKTRYVELRPTQALIKAVESIELF